MTQRDVHLIRQLYRHGPLSNQELSVLLGTSPSTVTTAARKLRADGVIAIQDARHFNRKLQAGERRKKTYQLDPAYGFAVVVEVDFDCLVVHECRFDLSVTDSRRIPLAGYETEKLLDRVDMELAAYLNGRTGGRLLGIGLSVPGQVDVVRRIGIHNTRIENWTNVDLNRFASYSENLVAENVANAVAIGEHLRGSARDVEDFLVLHVGNGAGMGIVIGGRLHRGHNFAAGEAGHVIVDEASGVTCNCGNRGCLESFVSRRAVLKNLGELRESNVPSGILSTLDLHRRNDVYRLLGDYYDAGDKVAYLVVEELAHKLGLATANIARVLAPSRIVLSGPITALGRGFMDRLEQSLLRYHLPWLDPVPVVYGEDDSISAARGIGAQVFANLWPG